MRLSEVGCIALLLILVAPALAVEPIVIAHRGASGYLPEHTLAAYEKAIDMGADYIEPDLVITKDGELIARHDHYLGMTTDIADHDEFAGRQKTVAGRQDWFTEDFTLEEIKTLRARQAFPGRSDEHDGEYAIPTLQEVIDLVERKSRETGRDIGLYPETKISSHFESLGFDFAKLLMKVLAVNGMSARPARVYIQSFEPDILKRLDGMTDLPLVQLVSPVSRKQPNQPNIPLEQAAAWADGIAAFKVLLVDEKGASSGVIERAHELDLFVHAWTFRDDAYPEAYFPSARAEIAHFLGLGIDGFFTDFTDTGVSVRDRYLANGPSASASQKGTPYGMGRQPLFSPLGAPCMAPP